MIGVYETNASAEATFQFYTSPPPAGSSMKTESPSSIGSGTKFVGKVKLTSPVAGDVVVLPYNGRTLIVIVLTNAGTSGPTSPTTGGTAAGS